MDLLSELLKAVALKGAVFFNAEFSAPWGFRSPESHLIAPHIAADSSHVIIYHLLSDGAAWAQLEKGRRVELRAGDLVIFPHGDAHLMGNGEATAVVENGQEIERILAQGLQIARMGGGGEVSRLVCGYMICDPHVGRLLLTGLPSLLKINIRSDPAGTWLENSIRFSVDHAGSSMAGAEAVLAKLSEALFVETLRRYIAQLPAGQTGWLAGARDPEVGKALALLHREPARPWTIADLAAEVGMSRAVLAERFRNYLGEPPIGYLTRWRMQLASRLLTTTSQSVEQIAAKVGYDSLAAFNRAYKREFGLPPARYRKQARSRGSGPESVATAG